MPNIKEMIKIIENTDPKQPILLEGTHGIGKSEILKDHFEKKGYTVITLFVGQASDAGDIIGLPKIVKDESTGIEHTTFCPPKWWPTNQEGKFIIILDELNRGRAEIMQCIMDMTLNRKLNGRDLPPHTQIVGAMNPSDENGFYQVTELDPAFLDRWNRYVFKPTHEEWVYWAIKQKVHRHVIGFITKHYRFLDPITDATENAKVNTVQPSRRSWVRVSENLKRLEESKSYDLELISDMCVGIIGVSATASFIDYLKKEGKGITASSIILKFDKQMQKTVEEMKNPELLALNLEIFYWFSEHTEEMELSSLNANKWVANLKKYLDCINPEIMAHFLSTMIQLNDDNIKWPRMVLSIDNTLAKKYFMILQGSDKVETSDE